MTSSRISDLNPVLSGRLHFEGTTEVLQFDKIQFMAEENDICLPSLQWGIPCGDVAYEFAAYQGAMVKDESGERTHGEYRCVNESREFPPTLTVSIDIRSLRVLHDSEERKHLYLEGWVSLSGKWVFRGLLTESKFDTKEFVHL